MALAYEDREKIITALAEKPGVVLEHLAQELQVKVSDVVACLPEGQVIGIGAGKFESVMNDLSQLGKITFIVHTQDIVLECKGIVPNGSYGRGYFNIHGDSPIGGHIKADNCEAIFFISRELMGRMSHSIQFYNKGGSCMYKVYLGRDEKRELIPEQVEIFHTISKKYM